MTHPERIVYGGVDTHEDVHVGAVIDATGRLLGTKAYPTTPIGLRGMLRWMSGQGTVAMVGVEGTGTYGLGLHRVLQHAGLTGGRGEPANRQLRRTRGKSDTVDAEAAARAVLAGHATVVPKARDGIVESIRVLRIALESSRRSAPGSAPRSATSCSPHRNACTSSWPPCPWPSKPLEQPGSGPGTTPPTCTPRPGPHFGSWPASTSP